MPGVNLLYVYGDMYTLCTILYCIFQYLLHIEILEGNSRILSHVLLSIGTLSVEHQDVLK